MNLIVGQASCLSGRTGWKHCSTTPGPSWFRGSTREFVRGILTLTLSPGEREQPLAVFPLLNDLRSDSAANLPGSWRMILPLPGVRAGVLPFCLPAASPDTRNYENAERYETLEQSCSGFVGVHSSFRARGRG